MSLLLLKYMHHLHISKLFHQYPNSIELLEIRWFKPQPILYRVQSKGTPLNFDNKVIDLFIAYIDNYLYFSKFHSLLLFYVKTAIK
jgi:hypothetical protein